MQGERTRIRLRRPSAVDGTLTRHVDEQRATRGPRARLAKASVAALAAVGMTAPAPSGAAAQGAVNTFSGVCTDLVGTVSWPNRPLTLVPGDNQMVGLLDGGKCTGTLNGRPIENAPGAIEPSFDGLQSCAGGRQTGPVSLAIAGRRFSADGTYHRGGGIIEVALEGSAGGRGLVHAHVDAAAISDDHPLAGDLPPEARDHPVTDRLVGSTTYEELLRQCATTGVSSAPVRISLIQTMPSISSGQ